MFEGRSRQGDSAARAGGTSRSLRGFVTMTLPLPRYVIPKRLADGRTAFYFNEPPRDRKLACTIPKEPLGNDYTIACGDGKGGRAAALNGLLDEWIKIRN